MQNNDNNFGLSEQKRVDNSCSLHQHRRIQKFSQPMKFFDATYWNLCTCCNTRQKYVCQTKHVFNYTEQIMWQPNPYLHNTANNQIISI
jgi:hypothetical protein